MTTTHDEHYPLDSILFLEALWGDGSFRPGGPRRFNVCCPGWTSPAGPSSISAAAPAGFRCCWRIGTAPPA